MNAIEIANMELALVFFKSLITEQQDQDSLQTQNLIWSTGVVTKAFETYSRK